MKRATNQNSPGKSQHTATGDTTAKPQHEPDQQQTSKQQQQQHRQQKDQPLYCPTDETDLTIGDQQQVSLLDPRDSTDARRQPLSVKGTTFTFAANMIGSKKTDNGDQAHQQQAKKQAGQKKKNILAAGDGADDDLESNSDARAPGRSSKCWILMGLLIALTLVVITIVVAIFLRQPDGGDVCPDINQPFQASSYRLFATKTLYDTALGYLSLDSPTISQAYTPPPTAASLVSISPDGKSVEAIGHQPTRANHQTIHYDKSSIVRPDFFSNNETLEAVHMRLTNSDAGCVARQLHYYGRHAARYPSQRELERLSRTFQAIKKRIDLIISPSTAPEGQSENSNTTKPACLDPLLHFSNWQMFAKPEQGNLITPTGAHETQGIASRFKKLFKHLFDNEQANVSIKVTNKIRTAQTAANFIQQLDKPEQLGFCLPEEFPSASEDASTINNHKCLKELIGNHREKALSFHKGRCSASIDEKVKLDLDRPALAQWITQSVSKSLKLENPGLTFDEMKALYDLCKYESAITGSSSIWCSLFTEHQMKFMEYMEDVKTFYKVAYGDSRQRQSTCLLTQELIENFAKYTNSDDQLKIPDLEARFHFTHSQVIQKLIASSFDLAGDDALRQYQSNLKSRNVPKDRKWQTSLLSPFSANIAFILYSCPKNGATQQSRPNVDPPANFNQFDVGQRVTRILVALNEQPVRMSVPGRSDGQLLYSMDKFYAESRFTQLKNCPTHEICSQVDKKDLLEHAENSEDDEDEE